MSGKDWIQDFVKRLDMQLRMKQNLERARYESMTKYSITSQEQVFNLEETGFVF